MQKTLTSIHNPLLKKLKLLQEKSRARKTSNLFVFEGFRELKLALKGGYTIKTVFCCDAIIAQESLDFLKTLKTAEIINISSDIYNKIAYRKSVEGLLTLATSKNHAVNNVVFKSSNPLLLVAEAPEKPGNIGALLRTADAANVDAVLIANPKTDLYNPNIIRSSVGCIFTNQIATGTTTEIISFLKDKNISFYSAILQDSVPYHTCDFINSTAIVVGTEATGLAEIWRKESTKNIHIPMQGTIDSLNVSVAAGILIFEAKRQRNFTS